MEHSELSSKNVEAARQGHPGRPRVAFVQPIIPKYRSDFLRRFLEFTKLDILALCGNIRSGKAQKVRNYDGIGGFRHKALWAPFLLVRVQGNVYPIYFFPTLLWHLIRFRPDLIVTEGEYMILNNLVVLLYSMTFGAKVVWWSLGKVATRRKTMVNTLLDGLIKWEIFKCHGIVGKNTQACLYYQEKYGIPAERILVAPNTIDDINIQREIERAKEGVSELREQFGVGPVVLYVGEMEKTKRLEDLIEAMVKVWERCPAAKLVLVGDGEIKQSLESMVAHLGAKQKVVFAGKVMEGVSKYFLSADVFVLPGLGGLAIPHAMIHGLPVIARIADGTEKDLIADGVTGYLLKDDDNGQLSEKILKIITNPELRREMGAHCRDFIETRWNIRLQVERMYMAGIKALEVPTSIGKCVKSKAVF